jgi:hypothetical protein
MDQRGPVHARVPGERAEPRELLPALAIACDPLALGLAAPGLGDLGARGQLHRRIGLLAPSGFDHRKIRLGPYGLAGANALGTAIRVQMPGSEIGHGELGGVG